MKNISPDQICFGLNRQLDESSISCFLQLAGRPEVTETLAPRLTSAEINDIVDLFSRLLRTHFSEKEYHTLFLRQDRQD